MCVSWKHSPPVCSFPPPPAAEAVNAETRGAGAPAGGQPTDRMPNDSLFGGGMTRFLNTDLQAGFAGFSLQVEEPQFCCESESADRLGDAESSQLLSMQLQRSAQQTNWQHRALDMVMCHLGQGAFQRHADA